MAIRLMVRLGLNSSQNVPTQSRARAQTLIPQGAVSDVLVEGRAAGEDGGKTLLHVVDPPPAGPDLVAQGIAREAARRDFAGACLTGRVLARPLLLPPGVW